MIRQRIYIKTVFKNYNYGSVLQCYALSKTLSDLGFEAIVVDENQSSPKGKMMLNFRRASFIKSCLIYPNRYQTYKSIKRNSLDILDQVSPIQKELFSKFINQMIPVQEMTVEEMQSEFSKIQCKAVIAGSDQIWGTGGPYLNQANFLQYAPREKRFSYAASMGVSEIPPWFKSRIKKYLRTFNRISVREDTLKNKLIELGIKNEIAISLDPTLLLPLEQWRSLATESNWLNKEKYIFMYFISPPSEFAIRKIKELLKRFPEYQLLYINNIDIEIKNRPEKMKQVILGPDDFLKAIDNSFLVVTDSFHGTIFSVKFHKQFIVFNRQYDRQSNQSSRIFDFLKMFDLSDRLCEDELPLETIDYHHVDQLLLPKIDESLSYLKKIR